MLWGTQWGGGAPAAARRRGRLRPTKTKSAPHPPLRGTFSPRGGEKGNKFPLAPRSGERVALSEAKGRVRGSSNRDRR